MKLRRVAAATALAAGSVLTAPLAAHADYEYPADEPPTGAVTTPAKSLSHPVKGVGDTAIVQVYLDGTFAPTAQTFLGITGDPGTADYIEIAGRVEAARSAVDHVARYPVTIHTAGRFTVQGYAVNLAGERVRVGEALTITVEAPAPDQAAPPAPGVPGVVDTLPVTGAEAVLFGTGPALANAVGTTAVIGARRRRGSRA